MISFHPSIFGLSGWEGLQYKEVVGLVEFLLQIIWIIRMGWLSTRKENIVILKFNLKVRCEKVVSVEEGPTAVFLDPTQLKWIGK